MRRSGFRGAARRAALIVIISLSVVGLIMIALAAACVIAIDRGIDKAGDFIVRMTGWDRDDFPLTMIRRG